MKRVGYALLTLLAFGLCGVVCQRVAVRGRFAAPYSTYGAGPTGARGLFELLTELGVPTRRWSEDLAALPAGGMLVALGGCEAGMARELSRYEQEELDQWIGMGGTLLVAGARDYLPHDFGVGFEPEAHCTDGWRLRDTKPEDESTEDVPTEDVPTEVEPWAETITDAGVTSTESADDGVILESVADAGATELVAEIEPVTDATADASVTTAATDDPDYEAEAWADVGEDIVWTTPLDAPLTDLDLIPLKAPGTLRIDAQANHQPLLGVGEWVHATVVPRGRGRVIWIASASLFQNAELRDSEGGVVFMRLLAAFAPRGPVSFDEYHLGVGEKRSLMSYLRGVGLFPVALQIVIAVLFLLWRGGARFGGVRREVEPAPLGTASYVASMASLLERAKDARGIVQILLRQGLRLVAKKHRVQVEHDEAEAARLAIALRAVGQPHAAVQVERMADAARRVDSPANARQLCTAAQEIEDAARAALQLSDPNKPAVPTK